MREFCESRQREWQNRGMVTGPFPTLEQNILSFSFLLGPGPFGRRPIGPGPLWAQARLGLGPFGPGPAWAWAYFGPRLFGPWACWAWPIWPGPVSLSGPIPKIVRVAFVHAYTYAWPYPIPMPVAYEGP